MLNQDKIKELQERIAYQKAIYRLHDCDDPALKDHFASIIKDYESRHRQDLVKTWARLNERTI